MKVLARNDAIGTINLIPGDKLVAMDNDREIARYEIGRAMKVDSLVIVEIEPGEAGLSDGIGAIFGRKETV